MQGYGYRMGCAGGYPGTCAWDDGYQDTAPQSISVNIQREEPPGETIQQQQPDNGAADWIGLAIFALLIVALAAYD